MKKLLILPISIFLFLFGISYVEAQATFTPVEESGKAALKLTFDTGYVGGIELKAKVSGDVTVSGFNFNSSFSQYTKRYSYDTNTNVLTIYIATGSNTSNLLDKNRTMNIGTLEVKSASSSATYSLELQSLSIVEASYASKVETDITTEKNSFVFETQSSSNSSSTSNSNNSSNKNSNSNTNSNSGTNSNSQVNTSGENNDSNSSINEDSNSNTNSSENSLSNSSSNTSNSTSTSNKEEAKKESSFPFIYVIIGVVVLAIVGIIAFFVRKSRD